MKSGGRCRGCVAAIGSVTGPLARPDGTGDRRRKQPSAAPPAPVCSRPKAAPDAVGAVRRASRGYLDLGVRKNRSPETHSTETMASGRAIRSCGGAKARSASGACRPLPAAEQGSRDGTDSSHSTAAAATSLHATGKGSPRRTLSYTRLIRPRTIASATLNGVSPVSAARRSTSRVMAPMRATAASTASGRSSILS